jgi:hypothetical protein
LENNPARHRVDKFHVYAYLSVSRCHHHLLSGVLCGAA